MGKGKDQGRREDLVGGVIRSLGGWSQALSLRGIRERVEHDARILDGGDFVARILREERKNLRMQLRHGERKFLVAQVIKRYAIKPG